ncbi:Do family serine endopeptidase [Hirschia baltica]|uniref:Probable periplasmic serine endoprotease DegP-like n=1 Tax=Hirschia baltica (strain ATCC 49814 / DSM 5838 / IFAM 1418) TaxID=582402 RepID=C6XMZ5_HIRBI|nr:Do family serine endopeptidase [Hirschia baltica]ACT58165.1 protease Do [Hirschia baltica ATCC 49814]
MRQSHLQASWSVALTLCVGLVLGCFSVASAQTAIETPAQAPQNAPDSFSKLAARLMPSVVNISTRQTMSAGSGIGAFGEDSPLEEFNEFFNRDGDGLKRVSSLGSGFIIDVEGYVVTNNHVIESADEIDVVLSDGTILAAELVGRDAATDLALLKVVPEAPLISVDFGDSDSALVGDWVVAIGNPFGLGGTVTAGIVSARDRNINAGQYDDFIQTDAAINKGNSGGPLFNLNGEVIGVNTAIYSPSGGGGSVGVGFSVPSNLTTQIVQQLKDKGFVERGWLGVRVQGVTPELARSYGRKRAVGAIVTHVTENSPASRAGLEIGDLIYAFHGQEIKETRDLSSIVASAPIGEGVAMSVLRKKKETEIVVTLDLMESDVRSDEPVDYSGAPSFSNLLGVELSVISDEDRRRYRIPASVEGVVVVRVEPGSDAIGKLSKGDVIVEVNFLTVRTPDEAIAEAEIVAARGEPVLLQFYRDGDTTFRSIRTRQDS